MQLYSLPSGRVALRNLGRDSNRFAPGSQSVLWTDIGGLEEANQKFHAPERTR